MKLLFALALCVLVALFALTRLDRQGDLPLVRVTPTPVAAAGPPRVAHAPVPAGEVTRFDIEVFPTVAQLAAGHRLRLTLTTSDTPHLVPTLPQGQRLAGGVYEIQRNAAAASFVQIPVAAPDAFAPCAICR